MQVSHTIQTLAKLSSIVGTVAVLAKTFVPFYLMGSTVIFSASVSAGLVLVALSWRPIFDAARRIPDTLIVAALFYVVVVVSLKS